MHRLFALVGGVTLAGAALGVAPRAEASAGSGPGVPTSTVREVSAESVRYCVQNYAPVARIAIRDMSTGSVRTVRTSVQGSGCVDLPVAAACNGAVRQTIVASGTGADGNPATSMAVAALSPPASCAADSPSGGADDLRLTSIEIAGLAAIVLGAAAGVVLVVRRRRTPEA